jgi:HK97 family phage major capsid protein
LFNEDRTRLLGKPWSEVSDMSVKPTTKDELVLVYGDIASALKIVDRVGMTVSQVPHLFGGEGRPTGESGLYCYWRTGSVVQIANAIRVLSIKE